MAGTDHLHELIKSLSPHEKRYFKIQCQLQKGEKKYLKVFDLIDHQSVYNERSIKAQLQKDEKLYDSFAVVKNYLYHFILKTLRSFHSKKNIDQQIYNCMIDVTLLESRGLYHQAKKALDKAHKLASKYHRLSLLIPILKKKISYLFSVDKKQLPTQLKVLTKEVKTLNDAFALESELFTFYYQFAMLERTNSYSTEEKKNILEEWDLFQPEIATGDKSSFYSSYILECIYSSAAKLDHAPEERLAHYLKAIAIWEAHPHFIKAEPHIYKLHLANLLNCYFANKQWDVYLEVIKKIKAVPSRNFHEEAATFQATAYHELLYFLNTEQLEHAEASLAEITVGIKKYLAKINTSRVFSFYYNISVLYFLLDQYDKALFWLNQIINHPKTDHRKDIQRFSNILQLFYHFELGHFKLLDHLLASVKRKLNKPHSPLSNFEQLTISEFKKILYASSSKARLRLIEALKEQLMIIARDSQELGVEEILAWTKKDRR